MKVILLKDVAKIGRRLEVREVPDGHALNFLIPRKLAEIATPQGLRRLEELKKKQAEGKVRKGTSFKEALETLSQNPPTIYVEANEKGHLFKGIKVEDIANYLTGQGFDIEEKNIVLAAPLKEIGVHEITLTDGTQKGIVTVTLATST